MNINKVLLEVVSVVIILCALGCAQRNGPCFTMDKNDIETSTKSLIQYLKTNPHNLDSLSRIAMNYYKLSELDTALYYYNQISSIDPDYNCNEASRGIILLATGKKDKACSAFSYAAENNCDLEIIDGDKLSAYIEKNCKQVTDQSQ